LCLFVLPPWRWRQQILPECRWVSTGLQGITLQKMVFFIVIALVSSNPICNKKISFVFRKVLMHWFEIWYIWLRVWTRLLHQAPRKWTRPRQKYDVNIDELHEAKISLKLIPCFRTSHAIKCYDLTPWSESASELTDQATAACRRSDCQLLRIEGATWPAWGIPSVVFSVF
jgi:hypothetical protein